MADEITSEQLEDYTEAFNLFNQVILLGFFLLWYDVVIYYTYTNLYILMYILIITGWLYKYVAARNNYALVGVQPMRRRIAGNQIYFLINV